MFTPLMKPNTPPHSHRLYSYILQSVPPFIVPVMYLLVEKLRLLFVNKHRVAQIGVELF